jgi:NADH dehydrogenase
MERSGSDLGLFLKRYPIQPEFEDVAGCRQPLTGGKSMKPSPILITGISGSIGGSLASYLKALGYEVYGSVRSGRSKNGYAIPSEHIIDLDLRDTDIHLPDGLFAVVHCAAATSESTTDPEQSKRINIDGTERLLSACRRKQVKKFIFISSMSAANPNNPSLYAQTKIEAEKIVIGADGIETVVLRPGLVITSCGKGIFNKMASLIKSMPVVPLIGTNNRLSTISMDDLCRAIQLSMENPGAVNRIIEVAADEALSLKEIVKGIEHKTGRKKWSFIVPYGAALFIAGVLKRIGKPLITADNVYGLKYLKSPDTILLRELLGIKAATFEETLRKINF